MKLTRTFALCLSALLLLATLGACQTDTSGNPDAGSAPEAAPAENPVEGDNADPAPSENAQIAGLPLVEEMVSYRMAASLSPNWGNPENGEFWQQMETETNVHIEWITYLENEADEKFSLLMASADYPDAFIGGLGGGDSNIITYGSQGIYLPLNDLIQQYAPNFLSRGQADNPEILNMITAPDGNIYSMPSILYNPNIYNNAFINKTWLDALDLEVPTTTEDFTEVLRRFKAEDPNGNSQDDEIPMTFIFRDWGAADHGPFFGAFGYPLTPDYTLVDSDKVIYLGAVDSFRQGAAWMSELYAEGLIDLEVFTQEDSQYSAKLESDPVSVGVFSTWNNDSKNSSHYVPLMPLTGPEGEANWIQEFITGWYRDQFIITHTAQDPELLMRWVDQFYRDAETSLNATHGIGPDPAKSWDYAPDGSIVWADPEPAEYERGQQQLPFAPAIIGDEGRQALSSSGNALIKANLTKEYAPYVTKFTNGTWKRWPKPFMTLEETEELSTLENDLTTYSKNQLARWIAGEANVEDEWEGYLQELDNIGLKRWQEKKQQVYDRYMGQ